MQLRIGVWSKPMETVGRRAQAAFWYRLRFYPKGGAHTMYEVSQG